MRQRGFIYTMDAVFAMIAVIALAGALYTNATLGDARLTQFDSLKTQADENAWLSFYFTSDENQSPNLSNEQFNCEKYTTYNSDNAWDCVFSPTGNLNQAKLCNCDGNDSVPGGYPAGQIFYGTKCLDLINNPFSCPNYSPNSVPPVTQWSCLKGQYGPDENVLVKKICRGSK